jgi:membrane-associated protease RseP (regulator of RpoE activity)
LPKLLWGDRLWLHVLLFLLTALTTTAIGARLAFNFEHNLPPFDLERDFVLLPQTIASPRALVQGLPYSLTLLTILVAHELGHYVACLFYRIDASLPYFLPAPTFIGTFGAFIRFRSVVRSRRELFDVAVAGPLAGFLFVIPALGLGMALSKVVGGIGQEGELRVGTPLLLWILERLTFPGVSSTDIYLHPIARAAWVGLLSTALNLLPIGQLDGGHIVYALFGERHRQISLFVICALVPLGFVYWPWWIWAGVLFFLGRRHFSIVDASRLGPERVRIAAFIVAIFVLSFIPAPVMYNGEQGWLP